MKTIQERIKNKEKAITKIMEWNYKNPALMVEHLEYDINRLDEEQIIGTSNR